MHWSSKVAMEEFRKGYAAAPCSVLDVGSLNMNGSYRDLFTGYKYTGVDIVAGPDVDIVLDEPYKFPFKDNTFDAVISGQAFEHIEFPEKTLTEIVRVMKPGACCCIIAPANGGAHEGLPWYGTYSIERFAELARNTLLEVIENKIGGGTNYWVDAIFIARKPAEQKKRFDKK